VDHPTCYGSRAGQFTWHRLQLCGAARQHIRPTVFLRSVPRRHHVQYSDITDEINNNNIIGILNDKANNEMITNNDKTTIVNRL